MNIYMVLIPANAKPIPGSVPAQQTRFHPAQLSELSGTSDFTAIVLFVTAVIGLLLLVLSATILGKSYLERRHDRQRAEVRRSVRDEFYRLLMEPDPNWDSFVDSLSDIERQVLVDEVVRSTELIQGAKMEELSSLADSLELRKSAKSGIQSNSRYRKLRGLKLFISFGWQTDPQWLLEVTSNGRDVGEAAIRVLANGPNRVTRLTGVEIAQRFDGLSVYGMNALYLLIREDPAPLLEQLDRQTDTEPQLLEQFLRILAKSETLTGEAPLDGVLDCLEHNAPAVRRAACTVLADYGWRPDVRDKVDIMVADLFEDPSTAVRISAYEMLGKWSDASARAKLATAAESESNSRALFAIARGLSGDTDAYLSPDAHPYIEESLEAWADVYELGNLDRSRPA